MSPRYGRGISGERIVAEVPFNRGNRLTMIGAISIEKVEAALYGEWTTNGEIFLNFIEQCLCPVLKKDQIVILDNVAFHQVEGVKELIEETGSKLMYLPPYSPEYNPIEAMWSKIKIYLRKMAARTLEQFQKEIKNAFCSVTSGDLTAWFKHAGYK